jgi:hypothetical protein
MDGNEVKKKIKWLEKELARERKVGHTNAVKAIERDLATLRAVTKR